MLREEEEGGYVIDGLKPDDKLEYMQNIVYPQFQKYFKEGNLWITKFESVVKLMIDRVLSSSSFDAKVWYVKQFYRMKIVALRECAALMQGFIQSKDHHHFPIYRKMLHRRSNERRNFVGGYLTVCSTEGLRYELRDLRAVVTGKRGRKIDAFESEIDADHAAANEYSKTVMNISAKFLKHIRSGMFKVDSNDTSNYLSCKAFDGEDKLLSEVRLVETEIRKSLYSFEDLMKLRVDEYEDIGPTSLKISKAVLDDEDNEKMTMPVEESVNEIKRAFGIDPLEQEKNAKRFRNESLYEQPEDAHFFASPNRPKKQISTDIYLEGTLSDSAAGVPSYYLSVPVIVKYTELRSEGGNEKLIKRSAETTYHFMKYCKNTVCFTIADFSPFTILFQRIGCAAARGGPFVGSLHSRLLCWHVERHTEDSRNK